MPNAAPSGSLVQALTVNGVTLNTLLPGVRRRSWWRRCGGWHWRAADGISGRQLTANRWNPDAPTAALDETGSTR